MLLVANYGYNADVTKPRHMKAERIVVRETVPVMVPEIDEADAPVACWWPTALDQGRGLQAIRSIDGRLFRPLMAKDDAVRSVAAPSAWRGDAAGGMVGLDGLEDIARSLAWAVGSRGLMLSTLDGVPADEVQGRKVVPIDREVREAAAVKAFGDLRLVDGVVYTATSEPTFALDLSYSARLDTDTSEYQDGYFHPGNRYQAHQFDRVLARFVAAGGHAQSVEWMRPEVPRPDLLAPDLLEENVRRTAALMLHTLSSAINDRRRSILQDLSREAMRAYAGLRDAEGSSALEVMPYVARLAEEIRGVYGCTSAVSAADSMVARCHEDGLEFEDLLVPDIALLGGL